MPLIRPSTATPATASWACGYLRTNVLSARPDLKKYTALRFPQEVKRHADAIGPGQDVVLMFMEALDLEQLLTLVCTDLHLKMEGYPIERGRRSRSRCYPRAAGDVPPGRIRPGQPHVAAGRIPGLP
jgi:hypothetical protein